MAHSIKLHIWPGVDGLASSSPFCLKVMLAMQSRKIPYTVQNARAGAPKWALRQRLPVMELGELGKEGEAKVEDSTAILKRLDREFSGGPLFFPTSAPERAETLLLEAWGDETFFYHLAYYRWMVDHHFVPFADQILASIPSPVRGLVARKVRKDFCELLVAAGVSCDTDSERREKFTEDLFVLEKKLGAKPFLVHDQPTAADFGIYPFLKMIRAGKIQELAPAIEASSPIMKWMGRVEEVSSAGAP